MTRTQPTGVKADKSDRILTITWADGHVSRYPFSGLRAACPCVECKGGHANMGNPGDPAILAAAPESDVTVEKLNAVGAYALQFTWSDGHFTGIYTWDYLRELAPGGEESQ